MSGISAGCRRLRSKVLEKMISAELPVSTRIFPMVQPCILASMTNASVWGEAEQVYIFFREYYGHVRPLYFLDGSIHHDGMDLSKVVSSLLFVLKL